MSLQRQTRLQVMLDEAELALVDDWRFAQRMPSRAAAIRQLITLGLQSVGYQPHAPDKRSQDFGVTAQPANGQQKDEADRRSSHTGDHKRDDGASHGTDRASAARKQPAWKQ